MHTEWPGLSREELASLASDYTKSVDIVYRAARADNPDDEAGAAADFVDLKNVVNVQLLRAVLDLGAPPDKAEDCCTEVMKLAARMGASRTA